MAKTWIPKGCLPGFRRMKQAPATVYDVMTNRLYELKRFDEITIGTREDESKEKRRIVVPKYLQESHPDIQAEHASILVSGNVRVIVPKKDASVYVSVDDKKWHRLSDPEYMYPLGTNALIQLDGHRPDLEERRGDLRGDRESFSDAPAEADLSERKLLGYTLEFSWNVPEKKK